MKGGKADKKAERSKSPAKGKGGKKTPEPPSPKNDSKLRRRGEEDTDSKYIGEYEQSLGKFSSLYSFWYR